MIRELKLTALVVLVLVVFVLAFLAARPLGGAGQWVFGGFCFWLGAFGIPALARRVAPWVSR